MENFIFCTVSNFSIERSMEHRTINHTYLFLMFPWWILEKIWNTNPYMTIVFHEKLNCRSIQKYKINYREQIMALFFLEACLAKG